MSGSPTPTGGGGGVPGGVSSSVASNAVGVPTSGGNNGPPVVGNPADHFCLRWNNYQTNMTAVFDQLLQEEVSNSDCKIENCFSFFPMLSSSGFR